MSMRDTIIDKLTENLEPSLLEVIDESGRHHAHQHRLDHSLAHDHTHLHRHDHSGHSKGGETHFRIRIATRHFDGLSRVAQHRLVMKALEAEIKAGVHALAIEVVQA